MRIILTILALSCTLFAFAKQTDIHKMTQPTHPENIHILLEKDVSEALLEVRGSYTVFNPQDGQKLTSGILNKRFLVYARDSGIQWGEHFPGYHQIYITPTTKETAILVNGKQYTGGIAVFQIGNKISIINDLSVEDFIKSTLSKSFAYPLEDEVMSAIAILARTNAYYQIQRNQKSFWHIQAQEVGYEGTALVIPNSTIEHAVDTTRDLILTQKLEDKNLAFAAEWTEHSAGKTAAYQTIYRVEALSPKVSVDTPHAALDRLETEWSYKISRSNLASLLGLEHIDRVETFLDKTSKKTYAIRVHCGQEHKDFDFVTFQEKLGKDHILSTDFSVRLKNHQFQFVGYGKGTGVGLCLFKIGRAHV